MEPAGLLLSLGTPRDPQGLARLQAGGWSSAGVPGVPLSLCARPRSFTVVERVGAPYTASGSADGGSGDCDAS